MSAEANNSGQPEVNIERAWVLSNLADIYRNNPCAVVDTECGLAAVVAGYVPSDRSNEPDVNWGITVSNYNIEGEQDYGVDIMHVDPKTQQLGSWMNTYHATYPDQNTTSEAEDRRIRKLLERAVFTEEASEAAAARAARAGSRRLSVGTILADHDELRALSISMEAEHARTHPRGSILIRGLRRALPFLARKTKND